MHLNESHLVNSTNRFKTPAEYELKSKILTSTFQLMHLTECQLVDRHITDKEQLKSLLNILKSQQFIGYLIYLSKTVLF